VSHILPKLWTMPGILAIESLMISFKVTHFPNEIILYAVFFFARWCTKPLPGPRQMKNWGYALVWPIEDLCALTSVILSLRTIGYLKFRETLEPFVD
jgi:hypothetical protein